MKTKQTPSATERPQDAAERSRRHLVSGPWVK